MKIPGYQIERELGRGGMAVVYLALQESLGRHVALKVLSPTLAADSNFTDRFIKEKQIIAQLSHPGIVTVFDFGMSNDNYYLTMELLGGGSLKERIDRGVTYEETNEIIEIVASALDYAHNKGCIHRDVKSQNIMFSSDGRAVLTDFGIAKLIGSDTQLTTPGMMIGSPLYMSPEQITSQGELDRRTDLYSLGVLYYQMLTGKFPYEAENLVALAHKHAFAPLPKLPPEFAALQPVFDKLLAKKPQDRFDTAIQFLEALDEVRDQPLREGGVAFDPRATVRTQRLGAQSGTRSSRRRAPLLTSRSRPGIDAERSVPGPGARYGRYALIGLVPLLAAAAVAVWFWRSGVEPDSPPAGDPPLVSAPQIVVPPPAQSPAEVQREQPEPVVEDPRLRKEAEGYLQAARDALQDNRLEVSLLLVERGLELLPESEDFRALQSAVQKRIAERDRRENEAEALLVEAGAALEAGDLQQGLQLVEKGLALTPDDLRLQDLQTRLREAQSELEQQRERQRQQWLAQAEQARSAGDFDRSLALLDRALEQSPDGQDARDLQALRRQIDSERRAQTQARAAAEQRERQLQELLAAARTALQSDEFGRALELLGQGLELDPDAQALRELQRETRERVADRDRRLSALLSEAGAALQAADLERGLRLVGEGLALAPDDRRLQDLRTRLREAQSELEQQREREARRAELLTRVQSAREANDYRQALALLDRELEDSPDDIELRGFRDQLEEERAALERQLAETARRERELQELLTQARTALESGDYQRTLELTGQGLRLAPESENLRGLQIQAQAKIAALERQIDMLRVAASTALASGEIDQGLRHIEDALSLAPGEPELLELRRQLRDAQAAERERIRRRGELLAQARSSSQAGDFTRSLALLDQGLELFPDDDELQNLREQIEDARAARERELAEEARRGREAQRLLTRVRAAVEEDDYERALALLDQGAGLSAARSEFDALRVQVERGLDERRQREQVEVLLADVREALNQGELDASLALVNEALAIVPQRQDLLELRRDIDTRLRDRERRERELTVLLAEAERARAAGDFDQALAQTERGLELSPDNPTLLAMRSRIAEERARQPVTPSPDPAALRELIARARAAQLDDPQASQRLVEQGLQQAPDDPELNALAEINRLLLSFDEQLSQYRLTTPEGDNAYDTLQQVFALDADNPAASAGIKKIADRYLGLANRRFRQGKLGASQRFARLGLELHPENRPLALLADKIENALTARASRPAAASRPPPRPTPTPEPPVARIPEPAPAPAPSFPPPPTQAANPPPQAPPSAPEPEKSNSMRVIGGF